MKRVFYEDFLVLGVLGLGNDELLVLRVEVIFKWVGEGKFGWELRV